MIRNSTIQPKKRQLDCGCFDFAFSKNRCRMHAQASYKPISRVSEKRSTEIREDDLSALIEDVDAVFSRYIRIKYADKNGIGECYTCGSRKRWQEMQNSHFIPRLNMATRFLEENCRPACVGCNVMARGNLKVFEQRLEKETPGIVEWLREQGNSVYKPTRDELKELLVSLRNKLKISQLKLIK